MTEPTETVSILKALGLTPAEIAKLSMNVVLIIFIALLALAYYNKDNAYIGLVAEVNRNSTRLDAVADNVNSLRLEVQRLAAAH